MSRRKSLDEENAVILAQLIIDEQTPDPQRIEALNKLLDSKREENFFTAMIEQNMDHGPCPSCGFETNWLVPEVELNKVGIVSYQKDSRVKAHTTPKDCSRFEQACSKRKVNF